MSGVALRRLARPGSKTACVLGCGEQGEANLEMLFHTLPEVEQVRLYNPSLPKAQALQALAPGPVGAADRNCPHPPPGGGGVRCGAGGRPRPPG